MYIHTTEIVKEKHDLQPGLLFTSLLIEQLLSILLGHI